MNQVRILGIGSPSGDDQAGWLVADALSAMGVDACIDRLDRPGANLIPLLEDTTWAILIDAMQSGSPIGDIRRFGTETWPAYSQGLSSHGLGVIDALSLARELGSLPSRIDLYGIEIGPVAPGTTAGDDIRAAARQLARHIAADLAASP
jgi:hydrogenase maturation protease